ncbi:Outer membrane efflux protein [compost metagenome]
MKWLLCILSIGFCSVVFCQETITLQDCLEKAEKNVFQTTSESAALNASRVEKEFHWWSLLPDLSVNTGFNTSFGRRLDPFTNTFATSTVNSQSFGLNSGMLLFNGFDYFHKRKKFAASVRRDELNLHAKQNELKIRIIETYVTLCKLSVQINLVNERIKTYEQIQSLQGLLIREGKINTVDTLKSWNSLLQEQTLESDLIHERKLNLLELNFQIGSPLLTEYTFDVSFISAITDRPQFAEKFMLENLETEIEIAESELKSDRSKTLPTLALNGLVGTGFSTNNKEYALAGTPTKRYGDQLNQNLYEGIGVYLSIPIFNRGEWLKTKKLNGIKQTELNQQRQLTELVLEKQKITQIQKLLDNKARQELVKQTAENLQMIYQKSLLLYKEGRITYTELETALMECQMKVMELESLKLDHERLKLLE